MIMKKAFSLVEIGFVLFVITAVFFAVVPFSVSNLGQAEFIADWKNYIEQVSYSFEALREYKKTKNLSVEDAIERIMHYMDAEPVLKQNVVRYRFKMMNGNFYQKMNLERFDKIYYDVDGRLLGLEYGDLNCRKNINKPCATVWIDLNSAKRPNIVGKDIFVYEIYSTGIEPYGKGMKIESLQQDCSKMGTGLSCSRYYLMGGDLK